jgi:hypothetical protein
LKAGEDADPLREGAADCALCGADAEAGALDAIAAKPPRSFSAPVTPAVTPAIATAFQSNFSWMPVATPTPWPTALASMPPRMLPPKVEKKAETWGRRAVTARDTATISIWPRIAHLFFLGGLGVVGLRSPIASAAS